MPHKACIFYLLIIGSLLSCDDTETIERLSINDSIYQESIGLLGAPAAKTYSGTGVPEDLWLGNRKILSGDREGFHCCGFTFWVVFKTVTANEDHLEALDNWDWRKFQQAAYGVGADYREKQIVKAIEDWGIGVEIKPEDLRPGDIICYQRPDLTAHQAVFHSFLEKDGMILGVRYIAASSADKKVTYSEEWFTSSGYQYASLNPARFYAASLSLQVE